MPSKRTEFSSDEESRKIEGDVISLIEEEKALAAQETELSANPQFQAFLKAQKDFKSKSELLWESIFNEMEARNIKSIKGEWGSITVAERPNFKVADIDSLSRKYVKRAPDVKRIGDDFKLTGKLPAGVEHSVTRYLLKRLK